jgi:hydrogenase small subunit
MTTEARLEYLDILWMTAALGCDGDTIAITAATQPSLEDLVDGILPGVPAVGFHNPVLSASNGDAFLEPFRKASRGEGPPFILVVEGSIPDERLAGEGCWAGFGVDPETGDPIPTCTWLRELAPKAWAVVTAGTCSAFGGVHAMAGNPTGCMGLGDFLGSDFRSSAGLPIVNVPGCPVQPDNFMETLLHLLRQAAGNAPMIPLDELGRPAWLFQFTAHEGCDRGGFYEQADFAPTLDDPRCIVRHGCWGPVVQCNVGKRGWMNGVGGCANVGGICIGCTTPGFPDKLMPFMNQPPGSMLSTEAIGTYGASVRTLRRFTRDSLQRASFKALPPRSPSDSTALSPGSGGAKDKDKDRE